MKTRILSLMVALLAIAGGAQAQNMINGHEYVDLGLPSGTVWAIASAGYAASAGYYSGSSDASAEHTWGSGWVLPTQVQVQELYDNCTISWETDDYTPGAGRFVFKSKKNSETLKFGGNSIYSKVKFSNGTMYEDLPHADSWFILKGLDKRYTIMKESGNPAKIYYDNVASDYGGQLLLVAKPKTISGIPDGWKVNGITPVDGKVKVLEGEKVTVTPDDIPAGKRIKNIKVVPAE